MQHVAIDLGGRESQICIRDEQGEILEEKRHVTRHLGRYLKGCAPSRVVVETCAEAFGVADQALAHGHEVRVVPATLVKSLGVGARNLKTDRRDAQVLSEVSCRIDLPTVHVPSHSARERKALCGMRERLVDARTSLVNCVRGWLRGQTISLRRGSVGTFPKRVRAAVKHCPEFVERLLASVEHLTKQIREADKELEKITKNDPLIKRLMTVPGVGPVTALRFVAAVDRVDRFRNAHHLQSYFGLVPGERQSSDRQQRLGITKAGSSPVRRALIQAAWAARRVRSPQPIHHWTLEIEKRRGKMIATVALARKLTGILYAIWRDGTSYQPRRATAQS